MRAYVLSASLLIALSAGALAQPATDRPLTPLPSPDLQQGARPSDYLRAAQGALAAGHAGEAENALEMAQTRLLDRSVPMGETNDPSQNPLVAQISQARQALAAGDRAGCMQAIQAALGTASGSNL